MHRNDFRKDIFMKCISDFQCILIDARTLMKINDVGIKYDYALHRYHKITFLLTLRGKYIEQYCSNVADYIFWTVVLFRRC